MPKNISLVVIDNILIADDILEEQFVCDLSKCKGGCCEDGDAGAPLEEEEKKKIPEVFEKMKHYLSSDALDIIKKKGFFVYNNEYGWVTPTFDDENAMCIYGTKDQNGIIQCGFEKAYSDGVTDFKKPISCHLYPAIVHKGSHGEYNRINYEPRQSLCNPACALGKKLKVPVYQFLKEPLIRKHGTAFYKALEIIAQKHTHTN